MTQRKLLAARQLAPPLVWVGTDVLTALAAEATGAYPRETGGVLLGYADPTSRQAVVCAFVGPGPLAVHRRTGFIPDHAHHEREVARIYAESGRVWSYLGDWHSHPDGVLALSRTDRRTLARIAGTPAARAPQPIMIVLADALPEDRRSASVQSARPGGHAASAFDDVVTAGWCVGAWQLLERASFLDAALGRSTPAAAHVRVATRVV